MLRVLSSISLGAACCLLLACSSAGGGGGSIDAGDLDGGVEDGGADDGGEPLPVLPRLVEDLRIEKIELYQALRIPLMIGGEEAAPTSVPLIADREALLRVIVEPETGWTEQEVTVELEVGPLADPGPPIRQALPVVGAAVTVFELTVPAHRMNLGAGYRVRVVSDTAVPVGDGVAHDGRFPRDGTTVDLPTESDEGGIDLVLVPVRYDYDGSGRLPDTSPEQLELFEALLTALYPISEVRITVREPIPWSDPPTLFTGNFDFGDLNGHLQDLKAADGAPSGTYYYGLVQPDDTFSAYCGRSCTTGQAFAVTDPANGDDRVGGGMGYPGERWAWTLAHELGHMHGRFHAPCGVGSFDADFPHAGATLGVWGYDRRTDAFLDPLLTTDMMGYCDERWISDYTYAALFERVLALDALKSRKRAPTRSNGAATTCRTESSASGSSCVCETEG